MKEYYYDKLLNINTKEDRNVKREHSFNYHPYEPTPYSALEELVKHHVISPNDHIVDFGCGLGRLNFFLHYHFGASVTGIEMNAAFFEKALYNLNNYRKKKNIDRIQFHCMKAEDYSIQAEENQFYFFNPFSIHIFRKVLRNIIESYEQVERKVTVILYYSHEDYLLFLERDTNFTFVKEIQLPYEYDRDSDERFIIYQME